MAIIYSARVTGGSLKLRKEPNTSSTVLETIPDKDYIDVDDNNAQWLSCTLYSGRSGYVMRDYVDTSTCSNPSVTNLFGGTSSSANIAQSSTRKGVVYNLQFALKRLGFNPGTIDGVFGGNTYNAVVAFQKDASLTYDGIVGPATKSALVSYLLR